MNAKSGKSFFVTGMSSGIDRQVEVESSGDLGQKKSHTLIVVEPFSDEHMSSHVTK